MGSEKDILRSVRQEKNSKKMFGEFKKSARPRSMYCRLLPVQIRMEEDMMNEIRTLTDTVRINIIPPIGILKGCKTPVIQRIEL